MIGMIIYLILSIVSLIWLFCIAPTIYFLNLVTGAPGRLALLGQSEDMTRFVKTSGKKTIESNLFSFKDKPVTLTQALTTGLLVIVKILVTV
jgi:hypothetical protein